MTRSDPEQVDDPYLAEVERRHRVAEERARAEAAKPRLAPYFPSTTEAAEFHRLIAQEASCTECGAYVVMACKLWLGYEAVHGSRLAAGEARLRITGRWVDPPWWGTRTPGL